jgi:hypothetical protein
MLLIVPQRCFDVLIVLDVVVNFPFLIDVLEVAAQLRPGRIAFFEVEIHVQPAND